MTENKTDSETEKQSEVLKENISVDELAALSSLSARRIYQLSKEGKLPKIVSAQLPTVESLRMLFQHSFRESEQTRRERLALLKVTRKSAELEFKKEQKKVIERDIARNTIISFAKTYHAFVKAALESESPNALRDKLIELKIDEQKIGIIYALSLEIGRDKISRIESECAKAASASFEESKAADAIGAEAA
jgi:hypothetical protein